MYSNQYYLNYNFKYIIALKYFDFIINVGVRENSLTPTFIIEPIFIYLGSKHLKFLLLIILLLEQIQHFLLVYKVEI